MREVFNNKKYNVKGVCNHSKDNVTMSRRQLMSRKTM